MDPQEALFDALDCMNRNDREGACEALQNLRDWIRRGGFMPIVARKSDVDGRGLATVRSNG